MNFVKIIIYIVIMSITIFAAMYYVHKGDQAPKEEENFFRSMVFNEDIRGHIFKFEYEPL